jgi:hypothetical protein
MTVLSMTVINKFQRPRRMSLTLEHSPETGPMGTGESVNLYVIRLGKCRTPIEKFKADAASGREIMRFERISVNQAPAWKCGLAEPCNVTSRNMRT